MNSDLRELYQELILDHSRKPRNFGPIEGACLQAEGFNPFCGDRVRIYVKRTGDRISDLRFDGVGCAISTASASLLTDTLKGSTVEEMKRYFEQFHALVTGEESPPDPVDLGKLEAFSGVSEFPIRVKCATLCWHTLKQALSGEEDLLVSTER
ncbi:MAG TPA: SUF system NifU family Fe-S cluster assembly protein [Planctomycetes bacterium]|nr:SUF system NifU family Fe-S cluster assembly protein [Planctomycetota bacterium]